MTKPKAKKDLKEKPQGNSQKKVIIVVDVVKDLKKINRSLAQKVLFWEKKAKALAKNVSQLEVQLEEKEGAYESKVGELSDRIATLKVYKGEAEYWEKTAEERKKEAEKRESLVDDLKAKLRDLDLKYRIAVGQVNDLSAKLCDLESESRCALKIDKFPTWKEISERVANEQNLQTKPVQEIPVKLIISSVQDPWKNRRSCMNCKTCIYFVPKTVIKKGTIDEDDPVYQVGRCRFNAPTLHGYPVVYVNDFCGSFKLDENKI